MPRVTYHEGKSYEYRDMSEDSFFLDADNDRDLGDDWDMAMDDFIDEYEDFQDIDFPSMDDDF